MSSIEYAKTEGGCPKRVICEYDERGQEAFRERDLQASEWTPFTPSEEERTIAHQIRDELHKKDGALRINYVGRLSIDWFR